MTEGEQVARTTFRCPAPTGDIYAAGAFDHQIGATIALTYDLAAGPVRRVGRLVSADVAADGRSILITIDTGRDS